jgi:VanZ family protein
VKPWKEWAKKYGPALGVGLAILIMSAIPGETVKSLRMDRETYHIKGHFVMYTLFCLSLYKTRKIWWKSLIISIFYGIIMEIMQKYIPGRAFEYKDILVNSFGATIALGIIWKRSLFLPKILKSWLEE